MLPRARHGLRAHRALGPLSGAMMQDVREVDVFTAELEYDPADPPGYQSGMARLWTGNEEDHVMVRRQYVKLDYDCER
jgi:hypothetical protein